MQGISMIRSLLSVPRHVPLRRPSVLFAAVTVPLLALYLATATWTLPYHIDPLTNAVTSWYLANTGSPVATEHGHLTDPDFFSNVSWFVDSPRGPVSQYPPGAAAASVPLYLLAGDDLDQTTVTPSNRPDLRDVAYPMPTLWPATTTAAGMTAAAMGLLSLTFLRMGSPEQALAGALLAGLGTAAWSVASDSLWQHGPAMFWVALGVFLVTRDRLAWAGVAFGAAILTRPLVAVIAAAVGLGMAWGRRSVVPVVKIGVTSALGMGALLAYNFWLFDTLTISGGYGTGFTDRVASAGVGWYLSNLWGGLFDPRHGLLIWSPFLLVLFPGLRAAWHRADPAVRWAAVGGVVYLLLQWRANRFSGGEGHFSYRYPLEALTAAAPLLFAAYRGWIDTPRKKRLLVTAGSLAVIGQGLGPMLT